LRIKEGAEGAYFVDDYVRPERPAGTTFGGDAARTSCLQLQRDLAGERLVARLAGDRLAIEQIRITVPLSAYRLRGTTITSCVGIADAKMSRTEVAFERGARAATTAKTAPTAQGRPGWSPWPGQSAPGAATSTPEQTRQACLGACVATCADDAACERNCASTKCK
jgi:hypothetical protein